MPSGFTRRRDRNAHCEPARNGCYFFDAALGCVHAPEIGGQVLVVGHLVQESLADHVVVLEAGDGDGVGKPFIRW